MAYTPPNLNLTFDVWIPGTTPASASSAFTVPGQLYVHSRTDIDRDMNTPVLYTPNVMIRTDFTIVSTMAFAVTKCILGVQDSQHNWCYYLVNWWEWVHMRFANEYVVLMCDQCDDNGNIPDSRR